ncbi:rac GTPase-activating protein 1-like [Leptopilina boulardi]|uniref:rac GTPase-activating protein 1-like n=1 Tax=Leptopilina boulardi TaxID=63433 RepID=UPI0021F55DC0|nr:rac GTPase-activating protein 1-like [Leptopilina boulardi]
MVLLKKFQLPFFFVIVIVNGAQGWFNFKKHLRLLPFFSDNSKKPIGPIENYAPTESPYVPAIILKCIQEVENRGMKIKNIYSRSEDYEKIENLLEKLCFSKKKDNFSLRKHEPGVIAATLQFFLYYLKESIIPFYMIDNFQRALHNPSPNINLDNMLTKLSNINRNTLAVLIVHLQRVADKQIIKKWKKIELQRLAIIFGPILIHPNVTTIVQHSKDYMKSSRSIFQELLEVPGEYWNSIVKYSSIIDIKNSHEIIREEDEDDYVQSASGGVSEE